MRTLGFSTTNDIFAENAWYFRNALVRANYTNLQKGIHETTEYLEVFLRNLLLNEKNDVLDSLQNAVKLWIVPDSNGYETLPMEHRWEIKTGV